MSVDRGGFKFLAAEGKYVEQAFDKALFALREQIHTDCNFFVKVDQGMQGTRRTRRTRSG